MSKFTSEEIIELNEIVNEYKTKHSTIELMQKSIESLAKKRDALWDEVESLKKRESKFLDKLAEKYGADSIVPQKLLDVISEDN